MGEPDKIRQHRTRDAFELGALDGIGWNGWEVARQQEEWM